MPKTVEDADVLLGFYHYSAEHAIRLRTKNPSIYFHDIVFEEQGQTTGRARGRSIRR